MSDIEEFENSLAAALEEKRRKIDSVTLPSLKEQYICFHNSFETIYNILLKKGLIQEDQYKYDQKISDIKVPDETPFTESEKINQLSIRLSQYSTQLDFVVSYFTFNTEYTSLPRLKQLLKLTKYFRWDALSENSSNYNTRAFAEQLGKIKQSDDDLSTKIIEDSRNLLSSCYKRALANLKETTEFQKEQYKHTVREKVLSSIDNAQGKYQKNQDSLISEIRRTMNTNVKELPFSSALIEEILEENYGPQGETKRKEILDLLKVEEKKTQRKQEGPSFKEILLESVRTLAASSLHLEECLRKILETQGLLENQRKSFGDKIKEWLNRLVNKEEEEKIYRIEYIDPNTSARKTEPLQFNTFIKGVEKRAKILKNVSSKMAPSHRKLESTDEEQIYKFLEKNLEELQVFLRRLPALDTYLRSELSPEERKRARGIKLDVNAMKNAVVKANKKKHEYVARKDEQEQLKRLGVHIGESE